MIEKKSTKKALITIIITVIMLAAATALIIVFSMDSKTLPEEKIIKDFYGSVLPDFDESELKKCVHEKVYGQRFNDSGSFTDRLARSKQQIVFYYGEDFETEVSDFKEEKISELNVNKIVRNYEKKYSLNVSEVKLIRFTVTLRADEKESRREEKLTILKIDEKWYIYDYDAYWFAFM